MANEQKYNIECRFRHNHRIKKRIFNTLDKISLDIQKEEKITTAFCELNTSAAETPLFIYIFFPVFFGHFFIWMALSFREIKSIIGIVGLYTIPLTLLLLSYGILYLSTSRRPVQILLLTDKAIYDVDLSRNHYSTNNIMLNKVSSFSIYKNSFVILQDSNQEYIEFPIKSNNDSFYHLWRDILYSQIKENILKKEMSIENTIEILSQDKNKNYMKLKKTSHNMLKQGLFGGVICGVLFILLKDFEVLKYIILCIGIIIVLVFSVVSYFQIIKWNSLINLGDDFKIILSSTGIEVQNNSGLVIDIPFEEDLIFAPFNIVSQYYPKLQYKNDFDTIEIGKLSDPNFKVRIGNLCEENDKNFYEKLQINYINWYLSKSDILPLDTDKLHELYINSDEFNATLHSKIRDAIQRFRCDTKRSSYRYEKIEPIMKTITLDAVETVNIPLQVVSNLPKKIEIPKEVIPTDCEDEAEGDKILTKDLLDWELKHPKEFYKYFIEDDEPILFTYHPRFTFRKRIIISNIIYTIFPLILILINQQKIQAVDDSLLSALWIGYGIIQLFHFVGNNAKYQRNKEKNLTEILFTDKKIIEIKLKSTTIMDYGIIWQCSKRINKKELIKEFSIFSKSNSINIPNFPQNSPVFAILAKHEIPILRSD